MMRFMLAAPLALVAAPAFAAGDVFFSFANTDFVVTIAFLLFIGVLCYFKVPDMIMGMLDQRAEGIQSDLDEARALREEAQTLLASYERRQASVKEQADRIVASAKEDAQAAAEAAKLELERSIARRLAAAEEQIASAEASAVKEVRDQAISVAVAVARDEVARQLTKAQAGDLIDAAIEEVGQKLH